MIYIRVINFYERTNRFKFSRKKIGQYSRESRPVTQMIYPFLVIFRIIKPTGRYKKTKIMNLRPILWYILLFLSDKQELCVTYSSTPLAPAGTLIMRQFGRCGGQVTWRSTIKDALIMEFISFHILRKRCLNNLFVPHRIN